MADRKNRLSVGRRSRANTNESDAGDEYVAPAAVALSETMAKDSNDTELTKWKQTLLGNSVHDGKVSVVLHSIVLNVENKPPQKYTIVPLEEKKQEEKKEEKKQEEKKEEKKPLPPVPPKKKKDEEASTSAEPEAAKEKKEETPAAEPEPVKETAEETPVAEAAKETAEEPAKEAAPEAAAEPAKEETPAEPETNEAEVPAQPAPETPAKEAAPETPAKASETPAKEAEVPAKEAAPETPAKEKEPVAAAAPVVAEPAFIAIDKATGFSLPEGSVYSFNICFSVLNTVVFGLASHRSIYRKGIRFSKSKTMIGSYPEGQGYVFKGESDTAPSGFLARGDYVSRFTLMDDDGNEFGEYEIGFKITK